MKKKVLIFCLLLMVPFSGRTQCGWWTSERKTGAVFAGIGIAVTGIAGYFAYRAGLFSGSFGANYDSDDSAQSMLLAGLGLSALGYGVSRLWDSRIFPRLYRYFNKKNIDNTLIKERPLFGGNFFDTELERDDVEPERKIVPDEKIINSIDLVEIPNQGNTCFLSSVIKMLMSSKNVRSRLIKNRLNKSTEGNELPKFLRAFFAWEDEDGSLDVSWLAKKVRKVLGQPEFAQCDAQGAVLPLINCFKESKKDRLFTIKYKQSLFCKKHENKLHSEKDIQRKTIELFFRNNENKSVVNSVKQGVKDYFKSGLVKSVDCSVCQKANSDKNKKGKSRGNENKHTLSRHYTIKELPSVLVISLKRYSYDKKKELASKITDAVKLNEFITVAGKKYNLRAFVRHKGDDLSFGHYVVNYKGADDEWYYHDDQRTNKRLAVKANDEIIQDYIKTGKSIRPNKSSRGEPYLVLYELDKK